MGVFTRIFISVIMLNNVLTGWIKGDAAMSRVFRLKYMKKISALMAGVILVGSMDINLLSVQAAQENPAAVMDMTMPQADDESGMPMKAAIDDSAEDESPENNALGNGDVVSGEDLQELSSDEGDPEEEPSVDPSVEIMGGTIGDFTYSGEEMSLDRLLPKDIDVKTGGSEIDPNQCDYYYSYSGTTEGGTTYDSGAPLTETELRNKADFAGPKDAGTYTCTVYYAGSRESADTVLDPLAAYGIKTISFRITKKQITLKAESFTIQKGDEEPTYTYVYVGDGLAAGDSLVNEPTLKCSITDTNTSGTYKINISGADAGTNYDIAYERGTLTIEDEDDTDDTGKKLLRIETPDPVTGVRNGTPLAEITLPATVTIVTGTGDSAEEQTADAAVVWDRDSFADETAYDPDSEEEQTFKLQGTVTLPEGVNANGGDLTVKIEITVGAKSDVPKTYQLVRIVTPSPVRNVTNGTALADIDLPETVYIVRQDIETQTSSNVAVEVNWNRSGPVDGTSYRVSDEAHEQSFKLRGTVVLPDDVDDNGVSLNVTIQVDVREKLTSRVTVAVPTASIESTSTVQRGTTVELFCETEGARIYYTVDGSDPTRQSNLYSGPIVLNVFTTIRAFAVKSGHPDSMVTKFTYSIVSGTTGGNNQDGSEVPKEDIPDDGKIPDGLWMTKVTQYVYTGKAIKPEVRVYDNTTLLVEKKDYTIAYKNNVNAASADIGQKAPTIIITGKGNYEGKLTKYFTIAPKNISDSDVSIDDIVLLYNKKVQKPAPVVLWNGKKLANKKDYTVPDVSYTEVGSHNIVVTGCGNYKGERKFNFRIAEGVLTSKLTVGKIPNQTYTGSEIKPQITVKEKSTVLEVNKDYSVSYVNNVQVGTATVVIKGIGRYAGTKKVTFKITEVASLSKANIDLGFDTTPVYTGREIKVAQATVTLSVKGESEPRKLLNGSDYTMTYQNNVKAGTATVVFTGKGAYRGTVKKKFKIAACDIASNKVKITMSSSYSYMKGGCKAEPTVVFNGKILQAGTDYTLSYKNNNAAGKEATVIVKGKGCFSGSTAKTYRVVTQDIGKMKLSAADKVYQNKKNIYKTTVKLTDANGKALSSGKDYDKNFEYTYAARTDVYNPQLNPDDKEKTVTRKAGDPIDQNDIIPAGTVIQVNIIAKGTDYTGTVSGTYRITGASIAGAKVTIPAQEYTGQEIRPDSQIKVELKGTPLTPSKDYEIVEYSNNINKGTARVVIHGLDNYGGTKTVTFKIKGKGLFFSL